MINGDSADEVGDVFAYQPGRSPTSIRFAFNVKFRRSICIGKITALAYYEVSGKRRRIWVARRAFDD